MMALAVGVIDRAARANLSAIGNNRLVVMVMMTSPAFTISESGVSRTLPLPVNDIIKNAIPAIGLRRFLGGFA
jgi:hypothetical protein